MQIRKTVKQLDLFFSVQEDKEICVNKNLRNKNNILQSFLINTYKINMKQTNKKKIEKINKISNKISKFLFHACEFCNYD